jgi:hypothetical protein
MPEQTPPKQRSSWLIYAIVAVIFAGVAVAFIAQRSPDASTAQPGTAAGGGAAPAAGDGGAAGTAGSQAQDGGASAASAAGDGHEPPNPFKAFVDSGKAGARPPPPLPPPQAAGGAAAADPFKAFLDSNKGSQPPPPPPPDPNQPQRDPFKEALEKRAQQP